MIVLVANLGSTSFKYKLFDMSAGEAVLAEGAAERIGQSRSAWSFKAAAHGAERCEGEAALPDHAAAIDLHLKQLVDTGVLKSLDELGAVGFKAVHGGPTSGAVRVTDDVLKVQEEFADVAPVHNPPYIASMKAFAARLPDVPQVAAFETAFHQTIPLQRQAYAIPYEWTMELGIRRYGFHGASHRYIAVRMAEIAPEAQRIISCHLGGSASLCAIEDGKSLANTFGMTTQGGLTHGTRIGDFDTFALLKLQAAGIEMDEIWRRLGHESGLVGISGVSSDMRDVEQAAADGNERAQLAVGVFVETVRHYLGAYLAILNGADAVCFTGGIGQHGADIRAAILENMDYAGICFDPVKNQSVDGNAETRIDAADSRTQIWVLPTNEELIVARQTVQALANVEGVGVQG